MTYTYVDHVDPVEFDVFVKQHAYCNLLQSSKWGKVKSNWEHRLTGLRDEHDKLIAAALVLIRRIKSGHTLWYIPRGPIMDYQDRKAVTFYLEGLRQQAYVDRSVFIKIDPPVVAHTAPLVAFEDVVDPEALDTKAILESLGFRHQGFAKGLYDTFQPRYQAVTFDNGLLIEDRLTSRRRRAIKNAEKRMLEVHRGNTDDLDDFCYLIEKTEEAKDVILRDKTYFKRLMDLYGDDCILYIARIDLPTAIAQAEKQKQGIEARMAALPENSPKKSRIYQEQLDACDASLQLYQEMRKKEGDRALLAGCLSVLYGRSCELLYAGFNRDYTRFAAQDAAYVATMNEAFRKGAGYVGMGGISGDLEDGLLEYKSHFDPHVVSYLGEFDLPVRPFLYRLYRLMKNKLGHRLIRLMR
ncbi:MAG: aminoacyltransferase [Clostridiaceae bacterium]|jgi:serine/alanine adding enzyme|nr:aminoacyltransferase [Clostridiaceae bacterium]